MEDFPRSKISIPLLPAMRERKEERRKERKKEGRKKERKKEREKEGKKWKKIIEIFDDANILDPPKGKVL